MKKSVLIYFIVFMSFNKVYAFSFFPNFMKKEENAKTKLKKQKIERIEIIRDGLKELASFSQNEILSHFSKSHNIYRKFKECNKMNYENLLIEYENETKSFNFSYKKFNSMVQNIIDLIEVDKEDDKKFLKDMQQIMEEEQKNTDL